MKTHLPVRINDIAAATGLSRATIDRVMNKRASITSSFFGKNHAPSGIPVADSKSGEHGIFATRFPRVS